jgi:hypothetical protein
MADTIRSSVSVVNTLLQRYLQVFFVCFSLYWPVFYRWRLFTRKWRSVFSWQLRYTSLVPSLKQPPPPTTIRYITAPVDTSSEKQSTQHCRWTAHSDINTALLTSYASSESLNCVYICIYLSIYINSNMIIYRHHVNWPTYNTKTAKKLFLLQQITPYILQQKVPQEREF